MRATEAVLLPTRARHVSPNLKAQIEKTIGTCREYLSYTSTRTDTRILCQLAGDELSLARAFEKEKKQHSFKREVSALQEENEALKQALDVRSSEMAAAKKEREEVENQLRRLKDDDDDELKEQLLVSLSDSALARNEKRAWVEGKGSVG